VSIYRFGKNSPIDEISILRSTGGGACAYVHALENADPAILDRVKRKLEAEDWQWTPVCKDGKAVLEVRGFGRKDENLLSALKDAGAIIGGYSRQNLAENVTSSSAKLRQRTLQASGFSYFVGDANFMLYGWKEWRSGQSSAQDFVGGIFYSLGSWFIALFGRGDKTDVHLRDIARSTMKELEGKGVAFSKESALHAAAEAQNNGLWKRFRDFCEKYPAELTNGSFGLAGAFITWASIEKLKKFNPLTKIGHDKTSIKLDIGLGLMTVFAGLVSVLIKEEKPDPNDPPKTGFGRLWSNVKERPLSIAGSALAISTLCHAGSTIKDYRNAGMHLQKHERTKSWLKIKEIEEAKELRGSLVNRGIFVATNLLAEFLMAISSKGHGSGVKTDSSLDTSVHAVMADLVLRTPEPKREALIAEISRFLSSKDHLACKPEEVEAGIRAQLEGNKNNAWNKVVPVLNTRKPIGASQKSERTTAWAKKMEMEQAPALQPAML